MEQGDVGIDTCLETDEVCSDHAIEDLLAPCADVRFCIIGVIWRVRDVRGRQRKTSEDGNGV